MHSRRALSRGVSQHTGPPQGGIQSDQAHSRLCSHECRRHALSPSVLYRWRAVAQGGSAVALKRHAQRATRKDDVEARHKAEIERMRAVIAEITAENLELKKRSEVGRLIASPSNFWHRLYGSAH